MELSALIVMNIDSQNHGGHPLGILAAAGAVTIASLIPALTMWIQFVTAVIGLILMLWGAYRTIKKYNKKDSNE